MAIKQFTASLNGGDLVTADNDLIFKIYGSADGYTTAIHTSGSHTTDVDVTVTAGTVVIQNVDVGTETTFKISAIDEAANESILSDAYTASQYKINFAPANLEHLSGVSTGATDALFDVTMQITTNLNANSMHLLGSTSSSITHFSSGRLQVTFTDASYLLSDVGDLPTTGSFKLRVVRTSGDNIDAYVNDVLKHSFVATGKGWTANWFFRKSSQYYNGSVQWMIVNGETFNMNEGSGSTTTGDLGSVLTLNTAGVVNNMWELIP